MAGAIILAGGQSSRMGVDKSLLRLTSGGPSLIEMVLTAVRPLVSQIIISTNRPEAYSWLNLPVVRDNSAYARLGPLAGVEAGLQEITTDPVIVVACDMPSIKSEVLAYLLGQAQDYQAVVPLNLAGLVQPLCAVYNRSCLADLRFCLEAGTLRMTDWLARLRVCYVPAQQLTQFDPDLSSFNNLNTPQDLRQFEPGV